SSSTIFFIGTRSVWLSPKKSGATGASISWFPIATLTGARRRRSSRLPRWNGRQLLQPRRSRPPTVLLPPRHPLLTDLSSVFRQDLKRKFPPPLQSHHDDSSHGRSSGNRKDDARTRTGAAHARRASRQG